jgi:hypothetical protein
MILGRAGPKHAGVGFNLFVGKAGVIGGASCAGAAQFVEDVAWAGISLPRPRCSARAQIISMSVCTPSGGSNAGRRKMTRPSRFVIVPSSSAHCAEGSTTSANCAVSERKKSDTARKSSALSRSSM